MPPKVLIIDDEDVVLTLFKELLSREGYAVTVARGAKEGIEVFKRDAFNLAIIDKNLDGISGIDILKSIKEINPLVEGIVITGYATLDSAIESIKLGAYDYILKPFESLKGIVERVRRALEKQRMAEENLRLTRELKHSYEELDRAYLETIKVLAQTIEAKDPFTKQHVDRVMELSVKVAEKLGLAPDQIREIKFASILHDVGKIGVSEELLTRTKKLTKNEFTDIRKHPLVGARITRGIDFLRGAVPLIRHHHERFDGKGYPDGLKGEEIPIGARIICVVDSFDAMVSDRPYRRRMPTEKALRNLIREAGKQFDRRVVETTVAIVRQGARA